MNKLIESAKSCKSTSKVCAEAAGRRFLRRFFIINGGNAEIEYCLLMKIYVFRYVVHI